MSEGARRGSSQEYSMLLRWQYLDGTFSDIRRECHEGFVISGVGRNVLEYSIEKYVIHSDGISGDRYKRSKSWKVREWGDRAVDTDGDIDWANSGYDNLEWIGNRERGVCGMYDQFNWKKINNIWK